MIEIDRSALDIGRRLQEGDELWRGDPTMSLQWNTISGKFEVWAIDAEGRDYMAWAGDECTPQILVDLTEWDWQRGSKAIIDKLARDAQKKETLEQDRMNDLTSAFADKVGWTLDRITNGRRRWSIGRKV